jgi:hypothetical protein
MWPLLILCRSTTSCLNILSHCGATIRKKIACDPANPTFPSYEENWNPTRLKAGGNFEAN